MTAIDIADNVAVVFCDESAGVGGAAEETVMIDNQTVCGGRCSERQSGEGDGDVEMHYLQQDENVASTWLRLGKDSRLREGL
ncbi:hypothetical protein V500_05044 [Pseudogymnoascus sp. VKM F-4518 (FW-2643)]|nr:hypothetical protein V500_05044 [Pseudogymnoascus sp. VKM F-4518 (FW-2643)]KFZ07961.1 hypothetical protein V502_09641 [Pseudogymnoascus sp. VKM F-4520 (FW-2644)]